MFDRYLKPLALLMTTLLAVVAVFVGLAGFSGGSTSGVLSTGRTVTVFADAIYLVTELSGDTATVTANRRKIVVLPSSLVVDGIKVGDIDDAVRTVEVRVKAGAITFVADGQAVKPL